MKSGYSTEDIFIMMDVPQIIISDFRFILGS